MTYSHIIPFTCSNSNRRAELLASTFTSTASLTSALTKPLRRIWQLISGSNQELSQRRLEHGDPEKCQWKEGFNLCNHRQLRDYFFFFFIVNRIQLVCITKTLTMKLSGLKSADRSVFMESDRGIFPTTCGLCEGNSQWFAH